MPHCALCKKKKEPGGEPFYNMPKDKERQQIWREVCHLQLVPSARICQDHFRSSDIVKAGRNSLLLPVAIPSIQTWIRASKTSNLFCVMGCTDDFNLYKFPNRVNDEDRRKLWLDFFDMEDPDIDDIFACERHFSRKQRIEKGIRFDAVPDKNPNLVSQTSLYNKKYKDFPLQHASQHEVPILIEDNEYVEHVGGHEVETLQLQEQSVLQIPLIQPQQCSKSCQTNTRLCGLVEVSDFVDDYRLCCFYCDEVFSLSYHKRFITHLKKRHHHEEEAFKINKYVSDDHDYTAIRKEESNNENIPLIQQPSFATVVLEPSALLPLLVKPKEPQESVYINNNNNINKNVNNNINNNSIQNKPKMSDSFLMPAPKPKPILKDPISTFNITQPIKKIKNKPGRKKSINTTNSTKKVISSGVVYLNNKRPASSVTPLSRCLKRSNTIESTASTIPDAPVVKMESLEPKPTELVFEYTPKDIMDLLLDTMKNYPVLWEFDAQPFNEDYYEAVEEICQIINNKWSLKVDNLKMRRSINRILRFYCSLYPLQNIENINEYTFYYDKCASFLPASIHDIAYARCSHCYKCFENDSELRAHLLDEQNRNLGWPYKCVLCKECYTDKDDYDFHQSLIHYQEIFRCKYCPRTFKARNKFNLHVNKHKLNESGGDQGKYVCKICNKTFPNKSRLSYHRKYHTEKKHKCHLCDKSFWVNSFLVRHLKTHRNEYELMCEVCGKGFQYHNNLREHMKKHTGAKITCNICNLRLRRSSLNRHLRTVHVACEGTIESTYRARNFRFRRILRPKTDKCKRKKISNKEKYYSCKICNIQFERFKFILEHNKEFHNDGPRYNCQLCGSEVGKKITLKHHYRRKHSMHPYQIYRIVDRNDDINEVMSMKQEELDRISETASYSLYPPPKPPASPENFSANVVNEANETATNNDDERILIVKEENPSANEMSFEEERLHSDTIQDQIMKATDNIVATDDIKIDDDQYMSDLLKMF